MIPSFVYRRMAMKAIRPALAVLAVVMLIAMLPEMINLTASQLTGSLPTEYLKPVVSRIMNIQDQLNVNPSLGLIEEMQLAQTEGVEALKSFWNEKGMIFVGLWALQLVMTPVLQLGLLNALLRCLRNQEISYGTALSRMGCFLKALLVDLATVVLTALWALPGMALFFLAWQLSGWLATALAWVGLFMTVVLTLRAAYGYAMAPFFMADHPEMGVVACVRSSVKAMKRIRMELLSLELSFIWWALALSLVESLAYGMLGNVLGMTVYMMLNLLLQLYVYASKAAFYQLRVVRAGELDAEMERARADMEARSRQDEDDQT